MNSLSKPSDPRARRPFRGVLGGVVLLTACVAASLVLSGCATPVGPATQTPLPQGQSLSLAGDTLYECIAEKGWPVELLWDGGVLASSETIPNEQWDLYNADADVCRAEVDQRILAMTDDEIRAVYQLELVARDCLIAQGYDVEEPPTEQTYVDRFFGNRWTAYGASSISTAQMPDSEWRTVNEQCHQPSWDLGAD